MSGEEAITRKELSAALVTEAAAWVARLHSPLRTPAVERGFRSWLAENSDHGRAFELVTDSWDEVGTLRSGAQIDILLPSDLREPKPRRRNLRVLAIAASIAAITVAVSLRQLDASRVTTGVGEQRLLSLEDGSRVYLNTLTKLSVDFTNAERRIQLQAGEALFEVVPQTNRPFVVNAGDRDVLALGTSFVVRRDEQRVAVTLVEGKVTVSEAASPVPSTGSTLLAPGERVTFDRPGAAPRKDFPALEKLTAWQRGKVPIENLSLADAVMEMNRYSKVQLTIEQPEARDLRVSGIFRVGDSLSFARAVSQSYGLEVHQDSKRIVLTGVPEVTPRGTIPDR